MIPFLESSGRYLAVSSFALIAIEEVGDETLLMYSDDSGAFSTRIRLAEQFPVVLDRINSDRDYMLPERADLTYVRMQRSLTRKRERELKKRVAEHQRELEDMYGKERS